MSHLLMSDAGWTSFSRYMSATSLEEIERQLAYEPECLADFIYAWVSSGEGVRACTGDFTSLLMTVIAIIDDWSKDSQSRPIGSSALVEPRPETIFGPDGMEHDVLDRQKFAFIVFNTLHPKP